MDGDSRNERPQRAPGRLRGQAAAARRSRWILVGLTLASALAGVALAASTPGRYLESLAYDLRVALTAPPAKAPVVVVKIDDDSLAQMRAASPCHCISPIDKAWLGDLIAGVSSRGARAVGVDYLLDTWRDPAEADDFARRIAGVRAPVVAVVDAARRPGVDYPVLPAVRYADARALVADDYDNVVRRYDPRKPPLPSLASALAAELGARPATQPFTLRYRRPNVELEGVNRGAIVPAFSAADVAVLPPGFFDGKVVLIGRVTRTAEADANVLPEDVHATPLRFMPGHYSGTPGVEVHAAALDQMLTGDALAPPALWQTLLLSLLAALGGAALARAAGRWVTAVAATALAAIIAGAVAFGVAQLGWMAPVTAPIAAFALSAVLVSRYIALELRRERGFYSSTLSRYLAPQVIERMLGGGLGLQLGAEEREITVMVTDLENFTGLITRTPLSEFSRLMNSYFGGLIDILWKYEATIDKMTGDGVIVFFGAPLDQADHAARALACAREIDVFAEAHRAAAGPTFGRTRIGLCTGVCLVGNFGGERRFNYTAYGGVTVTAARLEAAGKTEGERVLFTRSTLEAAGSPPARRVGELSLKGLSSTVEAFTLAE